MFKLTRRGLLTGATGLASAYWASRLFLDGYRAVQAADEPPAVVVAEGTNEDTPEALLRAALMPYGGISRFVKPGQTVAIKPNVTWANAPHTASSTDPDLLRALINMVKEAGATRVLIVDRSVFDPPAMVLDITGIGPVLEETGAEMHVLDRFLEPKSKYTVIDIPEGRAFRRIGAVKEAVEADVRINMGVAKTHIVTALTLCLKHMMGWLENPPGLHVSLDQGIADINLAPAIRSELHILEAIRVRVRGPAYGDGTDITDPARVKRRNKVLVGTDPVLIDAWATMNLFGRAPMEVAHIRRAYESNVGEIDVEKATAEGRLRVYPAAVLLQPTPTPTPTRTPTPRPTAVVPVRAVPTAEPPTPAPRPSGIAAGGASFVDLHPMLSGALVSLAVVIGGVSVAVGRRLAKRLPRAQASEPTGGPDGGGKASEGSDG